MCAITGLISHQPQETHWAVDLEAMTTALLHRGPDDFGFFWGQREEKPAQIFPPSSPKSPLVAFGHRRLSILDLSTHARQPMVREKGSVFVTYNGEIYNYRDLRKELEGQGASFQTQSDTEVLLEAYLAWGMEGVKKLRGIFAFGLADLRAKKAYLVRDHLGVKPLYYLKWKSSWVFASELKAFLKLSGFNPEVDAEALRKYLHLLWIPGEHTGLKNIKKLNPGTWFEIDLDSGKTQTVCYWSPLNPHQYGLNFHCSRKKRKEEDLIEELQFELSRSVAEELVSDVELGAFLSGGLDSSLVVSLMQRMRTGPSPTKTFSVGYSAQDLAYDVVPDDLPYARKASALLRTQNHEYVLSPQISELLPRVVWHLDEPLGDPAAISSFLICQAARKELTVMLSGMGGDELFAGYPRQKALILGAKFRRLPRHVRKMAHYMSSFLPGAGKGAIARLGRSTKKFLAAVEADPLTHYLSMETYFGELEQNQILLREGPLAAVQNPILSEYDQLRFQVYQAAPEDPLRQSMLLDLLTYLPCLNLAYTERTSMANGIEVRVPLLDIRLVEWSLSQASAQLFAFRKGRLHGKWFLKKAAEPYLDPEIIWRKKAGFGAPVRSWLRTDLVEMRTELLGPRGLGARGWFEPTAIKRLEKDFLTGKEDHALKLWMLISLELWARAYIDRKGS